MTEKLDLKSEGLTKAQALDLLRQMWEIRMFEDKVYDLLGRNLIKGASHLSAGQSHWWAARGSSTNIQDP